MLRLVDRVFPFWRMRNVAMFYCLSAVYNMWFVAGVWIFIWGKFMTKTQIGISDALTFSIGFLVELPSGVLADIIGRKKAIVLGNALLTTGNLLIGVSSSFFSITFWYLLWTIGYAFQSGATEALVYDSVRQDGKEEEWPKIMAAATVVGRVASLVATATGGLLFTVWFRLPYLVFGLSGLIGLAAALWLRETTRAANSKNTWSVKTYLDQVKDGVSVLLKRTIFPIALLGLSMFGIAYMYNWGLLRPLTGERFGFTPTTYAFLLSVISLTGVGSLYFLPTLRAHLKLETLLLSLGGIYGALFFLMGFNHNWILGGLLMISVSVVMLYVEILFSQFINIHTRQEHRATTLSAVAVFTKLPYVLLAVIIGRLADSNLLPQYMLVVGGCALVIWLLAVLLHRKQTSAT